MKETYDVYFSGACLKTADPVEVKKKVGAMFKLEGDKLDRLFSGKPKPIKRGVDMDQAVKFRVAFRDAGGLVDIVPEGQPAPTPAPPPAARPAPPAPEQAKQATEAPATTSGLSLAEGPLPPQQEPETPPVQAPEYGLSAPQDFNLSDCAPQVEPAPIPDTIELDLDKPGATIDETPSAEPLEIDTTALELDDSDEALDKTEPVAEPAINIDALSMSEAKQGSLEDCQPPVEAVPLPNIDHLKIDESPLEAQPQGKAKYKTTEELERGKSKFRIAED